MNRAFNPVGIFWLIFGELSVRVEVFVVMKVQIEVF
jgi:hypothetical protein